ncbi:MAG: lactate utilization protein B [Desulfurococcales archaeon]|jgi:L-lactate dehydrogenase complex protein LldG|nr:lactate utilization protein B [Desulfurococcales archaeon]
MSRLEDIVSRALDAAEDPELRRLFSKVLPSISEKVYSILKRYPYIERLAEEVSRIKRYSIENLESLVRQAMESVERIGGRSYYAKTPEEARRIIGEIVGKGKVVIKGKSMITEEIGLNQYLESLGNEVWETDLGMLILQAGGDRPSHPVIPALHLSKERVVKYLRKGAGIDVSEIQKISEIVGRVRIFMRDKFVRADVGITGANAFAADTGATVTVENESNNRLTSALPEKHVVVASIDKIVPTLEDAIKVAMVQAAFAGLYPPTYINIIAGPSSTADIEYERVYGAHGPHEYHVVFIDNNRLESSKDPLLSDILRCIRCGRCIIECPVYQTIGPTWGSGAYNGPMGVVWLYVTEGLERAGLLSMLCIHAGNCREVCPLHIDIPNIMQRIKAEYIRSLSK